MEVGSEPIVGPPPHCSDLLAASHLLPRDHPSFRQVRILGPYLSPIGELMLNDDDMSQRGVPKGMAHPPVGDGVNRLAVVPIPSAGNVPIFTRMQRIA